MGNRLWKAGSGSEFRGLTHLAAELFIAHLVADAVKELGAEEDQEVDEGENQRNTAGGVADDKEPAQQDSVNDA